MAVSDNADFSIRRSDADIQSRTKFEITSGSPVAQPAGLSVVLEGAVFARSTVNQIVELYDYDADDWEVVDTRTASRFN